MHREGIQRRHPDMVTAHNDELVLRVASAIATADEVAALLRYARLALYVQPNFPGVLAWMKRRMTPPDGRRANVVDTAAAHWRSSLTERQIGDRRGAVVERLAAVLVGLRVGSSDVHEEECLVMSDGKQSSRYDVLATPPDNAQSVSGDFWEGFECKMGDNLDSDQADGLCWDAERAAEWGDAFVVVVASALDKTSIQGVLQDQLRRPDLIRLVTSESFATLATNTPTATVGEA